MFQQYNRMYLSSSWYTGEKRFHPLAVQGKDGEIHHTLIGFYRFYECFFYFHVSF